jgi:RNA polymerase sigma-70 factor (ECF subfamily)
MVNVDEDVQLMLYFQSGDEEAFSRLVEKYSTQIINFIYRFTGSVADAEDLAQEVFLKIYRFKSRYRPDSKFSTWVYAIATNACLDYKKRKKRDTVSMAKPLSSPNAEDEEKQADVPDLLERSVERTIEQSRIDDLVKHALSTLPENQRLALILKEYETKSYEEISNIMECSISSVESLIFRARQNLKKQLSSLR